MVKNLPAITGDTRDVGLILGQEDLLEEGDPLQYSCLENPVDRGRLQLIGSQRVGHDLINLAHTHTQGHYSNKQRNTMAEDPLITPQRSSYRVLGRLTPGLLVCTGCPKRAAVNS